MRAHVTKYRTFIIAEQCEAKSTCEQPHAEQSEIHASRASRWPGILVSRIHIESGERKSPASEAKALSRTIDGANRPLLMPYK